MLVASLLIALGPQVPANPQNIPGAEELGRVLDQRANTFTRSSQDAVVLAGNGKGRLALAWQSRRQQDGFYGIYLRAYAQNGRALTGEIQGNANPVGHQMQPSASMAGDGSVWLTWRSFGADGDQGSIIARRFDADLGDATPEVLVNAVTAGHQTDPLIAALPDGEALVIWISPSEDGKTSEVLGRKLGPSGQPAGDAFRIAPSGGSFHRTPALATDDKGRVLVAYGRTSSSGQPEGVYVRALHADGTSAGDEQRLDDPARVGIEPVLDLDDLGHAVAAYLAAQGEGYELFTRGMHWADASITLNASPLRVPVTGSGYTSGIALRLDGAGKGLLSWSRHATATGANLVARWIDASGKPAGDAFQATARLEGPQRLDAARGTVRSLLLPSGLAALAWSGDAGEGDPSGANLTLFGGTQKLIKAGLPPAAGSADEDPIDGPQSTRAGARPHDLPVYNPRQVLDQDALDQESFLGGANFDFQAFSATGWTPPDPEMAVGPNHIVAMVNGGIGWWLKDGTSQFFQDINGSSGFWGNETSSGFVFDPEVVWDSHSGRFVAFASDANNGYLLAISDDDNPNGSWEKYLIPTTPLYGTEFVDSGNLAVDEDIISITGDLFSPDRFVLLFIDKASAIAGGPLVTGSRLINGRQSMGTATNYDAGNQPTYLAWSRENSSSTQIDLYAVTNRLAATPTVQNVTVTVPVYEAPNDPPQMGTSVRPELFEQRFWSAMVRDGQLWATHHQGTPRPLVRWYQFDLDGWPNSGNQPTLVQSGDIDLGPGIRTFFGSIWADDEQNMALTFARSSNNEFISMNMAFREAGDPLGTTQDAIRIFDSSSPDTTGRWGDYSATNDDPAQADTFWGIHEYRVGNGWRTRIGRIDLEDCSGGASSYCTATSNSSGSISAITTAGSFSLAANDLALRTTGCPANQFGLFFYGSDQIQNPSGDGFLCVGGNLFRLPVVATDVTGFAEFLLDVGSLPAGGDILSGSTHNFQFWFRDNPAGGAGFNFSDAASITFCD